MRYFITSNRAKLDELNGRNLGGIGKVTKRWVNILKHPTRDEWALCLSDDMRPRIERLMTSEEKTSILNRLKTKEELLAAGWFTEIGGNQTRP